MFVRIDTHFFITACIVRIFCWFAPCVGTHPTKSLERSSVAMLNRHSEKLTRQIGFILGFYVRRMRSKGGIY